MPPDPAFPGEIAIIVAGLDCAVIGIGSAFAAPRVEDRTLASAPGAAVRHGLDVSRMFPRSAAARKPTLQGPTSIAGRAATRPRGRRVDTMSRWSADDGRPRSCRPGRRRRPAPRPRSREGTMPLAVIGVNSFDFKLRRLRLLFLHRRRRRRDPDRHLLSRGHARTVFRRRFDPGAADGHCRRPGQHHRNYFGAASSSADAGRHEHFISMGRDPVRLLARHRDAGGSPAGRRTAR